MADLTITGSASVAFTASATITSALEADGVSNLEFTSTTWTLTSAGTATVSFGGASQASINLAIDASANVIPVGASSVGAAITSDGSAQVAIDALGLGSGSALTAAQSLNGVLQAARTSVRPRVWRRLRRVGVDLLDFSQDMADYGRTQNNPNYSQKLPL
jgi:hypothetical protein